MEGQNESAARIFDNDSLIGQILLLNLLVIAFVHVVPIAATYMDLQRLPLYAFMWCVFGFAAVSLVSVTLLLREFMPFLETGPGKESCGENDPAESGSEDPYKKSEAEILDEMKKLGM